MGTFKEYTEGKMSPFMGKRRYGQRRQERNSGCAWENAGRASAGMFVISGQDMNRVASKNKEGKCSRFLLCIKHGSNATIQRTFQTNTP